MSSSQTGIILPSEKEIDEMDIKESPLIGTAPRSVPLVTSIQAAAQDEYFYYPGMAANSAGARILSSMSQLDHLIEIIDNHIAYIYPLRSKTRGLEEEIKSKELRYDQYKDIGNKMLTDLIELCTRLRKDCEDCNQQLSAIVSFEDIWEKGIYCDEFIDKMCVLIFKLISLGNLCPTRASLSDDFSALISITKNNSFDQTIRQWINIPQSIRTDLMQKLSVFITKTKQTSTLFNIFWNRINSAVTEERFIYADMETAYIISLLFWVDFYNMKKAQFEKAPDKKQKALKEIPKEVYTFIQEARTRHPALILVYEFGVEFDSFTVERLSTRFGEKPRPEFNLNVTLNFLKARFNIFSQKFSSFVTSEPNEKITAAVMEAIPDMTRKINYAIHTIKEFIIDKHNHAKAPEPAKPNEDGSGPAAPPSIPGEEVLPQSLYELAMKYGICDSEREDIMQILSICRSFHEVVSSELPRINDLFSSYIQNQIQVFLESSFKSDNSRKQKASDVNNVIEMTKTKGNYKCSPHISTLLLLRAQLQSMINPDSASAASSSNAQKFEKFLRQSDFYINMLQIDIILSKACDQSALYYKEYFLELYRGLVRSKNPGVKGVVYFPVTSSLPYTLIDFAIQHAKDKQDITGSMFYPLSIYDDAAASALKHIKSKFLYNEIVAECKICVLTIVKLITDSAFQMIRDFFIEKFQQQDDCEILSRVDPKKMAGNPLRIVTVLQQNRLFLLGQHFDIKSGISQRLTELFLSNMEKMFHVLTKHGLGGIFIFTKSLEIMKNVHEIFVESGHTLEEFDILIQKTLRTFTPNSFSSAILETVFNHTENVLIPSYFLHTNPYRFIPHPSDDSIIKTMKNMKKVVPAMLRQTMAFVTVDHVLEFLELIDDGGAFLFIAQLKKTVGQLFSNFCSIYSEIRTYVKRISDIPYGSGCHKAYDRFEGAYRSFANEDKIHSLFKTMKLLGNVVAFSYMVDVAFLLKRSPKQQILAYLLMSQTNDKDPYSEEISDQVFNIFDQDFQSHRKLFGNNVAPGATEITPPFLQNVINELARLINENWSMFDETSATVSDFPSLTGFASVWSVLEFVFCMKEVYKDQSASDNNKNIGAYAQYGEGVLIAAAALLGTTGQSSFYKVVSIGNRIVQQLRTDISAIADETMNKYLSIQELIDTSVESAISTLSPTVTSLFQ